MLLGTFDDVSCNSDYKGAPEVTEADSFHYEKDILQEVLTDAISLVDEPKIVIISDDDIKKMKVDFLKMELRKRCLSYSSNKAEL